MARVVAAGALDDELFGRHLEDVAGVGRHDVFVARIVDDEFARAEAMDKLLED